MICLFEFSLYRVCFKTVSPVYLFTRYLLFTHRGLAVRVVVQKFLIFSFFIAFAGFSFSGRAADAFSSEQKKAVQDIIKEYLNENPEIILDSLENYRQAQQAKFKADASKSIQDNMAYLTSADAPFVGNADADVTVIEFFDYNCGYCKRALTDIQALVEKDKNVRFVFREMPILSPDSRTAALWALAAHKQGKYFEYHSALMEYRGRKSKDSLRKLAEKIGIDPDKLEKDAESSQVEEEMKKGISVARSIGVQGTPAFIINGELYPGYLGEGGLEEAVADARKSVQ